MSIKDTVIWYLDNWLYSTKNLSYMLRDSIKLRQTQRKMNKLNTPNYRKKYGLYLDYEKHFVC